MAGNETPEQQDWVIPAVLVGVIVALGLIVVLVLAVRAASSEDGSLPGQLEKWSACLRSEGANVPLVETLRDGGFRVTVDGSLVERGLDLEVLSPALDRCQDDAPESVQRIVALLSGLSDSPFRDLGSELFESEEAYGLWLGASSEAEDRESE
jgi:hypothetical protein